MLARESVFASPLMDPAVASTAAAADETLLGVGAAVGLSLGAGPGRRGLGHRHRHAVRASGGRLCRAFLVGLQRGR